MKQASDLTHKDDDAEKTQLLPCELDISGMTAANMSTFCRWLGSTLMCAALRKDEKLKFEASVAPVKQGRAFGDTPDE